MNSVNVTEEIFKSLDQWGDHPAFIEVKPDKPAVYTTAEQCKNQIIEASNYFRHSGIQKNFLVALFLENSVDFVTTFLGLMHAGAKPIPLKLEYRKIELDEIFSNAAPHAVIAEEYHLPILKPYLKKRIVIVRKKGKLKQYQTSKKKKEPADITDDIASINYTYQGYGYPLGAMVPYNQYLHGAKVFQDGLQAKPKDTALIILPMTHIFTLVGCLFVPIFNQLTSVIANTMHPRIMFEYVKEFKISHITAVPELYELLEISKGKAKDLSTLEVFVCGGSFLSAEKYHKTKEAFNIDLLHGYGLTEFTPASRNIRNQAKAGTVGPLCENIECKIANPGKNGEGEILLKTANMTKAYYKRRKETNATFDGEWFRTGDIGSVKDNHLIFVKERKETRKVNGNMVDLNEVKKAILLYEKVKDILLGFKDNTLSAQINIESDEDFKKEILQLKTYLKKIIAIYKTPKLITQI